QRIRGDLRLHSGPDVGDQAERSLPAALTVRVEQHDQAADGELLIATAHCCAHCPGVRGEPPRGGDGLQHDLRPHLGRAQGLQRAQEGGGRRRRFTDGHDRRVGRIPQSTKHGGDCWGHRSSSNRGRLGSQGGDGTRDLTGRGPGVPTGTTSRAVCWIPRHRRHRSVPSRRIRGHVGRPGLSDVVMSRRHFSATCPVCCESGIALGAARRAGGSPACETTHTTRGPYLTDHHPDPRRFGDSRCPAGARTGRGTWHPGRVNPLPADSVFIRACRRQPVPYTPVWFMRQAGRSLPEYRRVREGVGMLRACATPDLVVEITLQPLRRYAVDAAIFFSDIMVPLKAIGVDLDIQPAIGPVVSSPIRDRAGIAALRPLEPDDVPYVTEAVSLLVKELDRTPLIGFAGGPFTLASYLIEGGPSKNHDRTKAMMYGAPELWHELMDRLAGITLAFLRLQV